MTTRQHSLDANVFAHYCATTAAPVGGIVAEQLVQQGRPTHGGVHA
jgi:hypothetical protein